MFDEGMWFDYIPCLQRVDHGAQSFQALAWWPKIRPNAPLIRLKQLTSLGESGVASIPQEGTNRKNCCEASGM